VKVILPMLSLFNNVFTVKEFHRDFPSRKTGRINETREKILREEGKDMMSGILIRAGDGEEEVLFRITIERFFRIAVRE
jgi:hypothetical protein